MLDVLQYMLHRYDYAGMEFLHMLSVAGERSTLNISRCGLCTTCGSDRGIKRGYMRIGVFVCAVCDVGGPANVSSDPLPLNLMKAAVIRLQNELLIEFKRTITASAYMHVCGLIRNNGPCAGKNCRICHLYAGERSVLYFMTPRGTVLVVCENCIEAINAEADIMCDCAVGILLLSRCIGVYEMRDVAAQIYHYSYMLLREDILALTSL